MKNISTLVDNVSPVDLSFLGLITIIIRTIITMHGPGRFIQIFATSGASFFLVLTIDGYGWRDERKNCRYSPLFDVSSLKIGKIKRFTGASSSKMSEPIRFVRAIHETC